MTWFRWPTNRPSQNPIPDMHAQSRELTTRVQRDMLRKVIAEKRALVDANAALKVELATEWAMRTKLGELYTKAGAELDETRRLLVEARAEAAELRPYKERVDALRRENHAHIAERERQAELVDRAEGSANRAKAHNMVQTHAIEELEAQATKDRATIERLERELAEANENTASAEAELAGANQIVDGLGLRIASFERAEDAASEAKAKRYYDGLGDDR